MATSKTTNTYNRQNWEDAVSYATFVQCLLATFVDSTGTLMTFFFTGVSDFVPNLPGR